MICLVELIIYLRNFKMVLSNNYIHSCVKLKSKRTLHIREPVYESRILLVKPQVSTKTLSLHKILL